MIRLLFFRRYTTCTLVDNECVLERCILQEILCDLQKWGFWLI